MIKFPGSPPRVGPLCLPDGWPTGFFLPSALPSGASGVGWGASRGAQRTLPCNCLCPPSFPKGPESSEPSLGRAQLGLAAVAGGGLVDPSAELCLQGGLPGTDTT